MAKKRRRELFARDIGIDLHLGEFLRRLHQSIGGVGPKADVGSEGSAFRYNLPDYTLSADAFATEYLWSRIMRKFDDEKSSSTKQLAAMVKFAEAEELCASAQSMYRAFRHSDRIPTKFGEIRPDAVMSTARNKIERLLGEFRWVDAVQDVGFGPGATSTLPRSRSDLYFKFLDVPEASTPCSRLVRTYLKRLAPTWGRVLGDQACRINDSNCVTTVPKDSETDRAIAIEPQWNMFFQKGIGGRLRRLLREVGVNLNDQRINALRALYGSASQNCATIDLSMASDTVSCWLVHELLPTDWLAAMESCRSPFSVLPSGDRVLLRKFSSMGNGFTFELESLIFWAICSSVVQMATGRDYGLRDNRVSIYGDDIIVPTECYGPVCKALVWFGFRPNPEKSFADGPFRESCGMHGFAGRDVTPFYIRRRVDKLPDLFLLHNNLMRWSSRAFGVRDNRLRDLCAWVRSHAPPEWRRPRLCDGYGDGAFIGSFDECVPSKGLRSQPRGFPIRKASNGHEGFDIKVLVSAPTNVDKRCEGSGRLLRSLWIVANGPETIDLKCFPAPNRVTGVLLRGTGQPRPHPSATIPSLEFENRWKIASVRVLWCDLYPWVDTYGAGSSNEDNAACIRGSSDPEEHVAPACGGSVSP